MATSGGNRGAIHASPNANAGGAGGAGNPRKFLLGTKSIKVQLVPKN